MFRSSDAHGRTADVERPPDVEEGFSDWTAMNERMFCSRLSGKKPLTFWLSLSQVLSVGSSWLAVSQMPKRLNTNNYDSTD